MGAGAVRVSQVKPSNCFRLHPTSMIPNTQQSRFLSGCNCLEKLVLPSIFDTSLSSLVWNVVLSNNSFEWKNMTFEGLKTYCDPPTYFQCGSRTPTSRIYAPVAELMLMVSKSAGDDCRSQFDFYAYVLQWIL